MVSLLDIAPISETVDVNGQSVECSGVSAASFASLLVRFPDLKKLITGKFDEITIEALHELGPAAIAAIIAAGTGEPGNANVEKVAAGLPIGIQYNLLEAIGRMTLPGGVGPFVRRLLDVARQVRGLNDPLDTVSGGSLPSQSKPSSTKDT